MEVLTSIDRWFADNIYTPLRTSTDPAKGIADMFAAVDDYFRSGQRVCLVGAVAVLGASRDLFDDKVKTYFAGWIDAPAAGVAAARRWTEPPHARRRNKRCWNSGRAGADARAGRHQGLPPRAGGFAHAFD